jgi:hypothetical protein
MISTRSQVTVTSESRWVERMTVCCPGEPLDELAHLGALARVEALGGLVEDQHRRVSQQGLGDAHPLPVALGEVLDEPLHDLRDAGGVATRSSSVAIWPRRTPLMDATKRRYPHRHLR